MSRSLFSISAGSSPRSLSFFIPVLLRLFPWSASRLRRLAFDALRRNRKLVSRRPHGFASHIRPHAFHFEQDFARPDDRHPFFGSALSLTHTGFSGLLRDRLVREEPDPDLSATLDEAGHRNTRGFDLPRGDPAAFHRLQPVFAERNRRSAPRLARHATALLLAVLNFLGHQHKLSLPVPFPQPF